MDLSGLFNKESNLNIGHGALQNALATYQQGIESAYKPLTLQANAASKLMYANLMGPQFVAKLMGNPDILPNISDPQKRAELEKLLQAGNNSLSIPAGQPSHLNNFVNWIKGNPLDNSQQASSSQAPSAAPEQESPVNPQVQNYIRTNPQAAQQLQQTGQYTIPNAAAQNYQVAPGTGEAAGMQVVGPVSAAEPPKSWYENVGEAEQVKARGKELGTKTGDDIADLGKSISTGQKSRNTFKEITQILASPTFEGMRNLPIGQQHELAWYSKNGTKEQQHMVGQLKTLQGEIIRDSARDFPGQFRTGEQTLLEGMKVNDADSLDVAKGKLESLYKLNEFVTQKAQLANQYLMANPTKTTVDAAQWADKQINGKAIRQEIHNQLYPKATDADIKYMASKYNMTEDKVKEKLKSMGKL